MKNLNEFIRRVQLPEVKLSDETRAAMVAELERLRDDAEYQERCDFDDTNLFIDLVDWSKTDNEPAWDDCFFAMHRLALAIIEPPTLAETIAAVEASGNLKDVDPDDVYGIRGEDRTAKLEAAVTVLRDSLTEADALLFLFSKTLVPFVGGDAAANQQKLTQQALAKVEGLLK